MKTLIKVRQKHIKLGSRESFYFCPIALAVRAHFMEEYKNQPNVTIIATADTGLIRISKFEEGNPLVVDMRSFKSSRSVARFIRRFDTKEKVEPFNFYLEESRG